MEGLTCQSVLNGLERMGDNFGERQRLRESVGMREPKDLLEKGCEKISVKKGGEGKDVRKHKRRLEPFIGIRMKP